VHLLEQPFESHRLTKESIMATKKSSPAVETVEQVEAADLLPIVNVGIM